MKNSVYFILLLTQSRQGAKNFNLKKPGVSASLRETKSVVHLEITSKRMSKQLKRTRGINAAGQPIIRRLRPMLPGLRSNRFVVKWLNRANV
jgi:hypothetical protein